MALSHSLPVCSFSAKIGGGGCKATSAAEGAQEPPGAANGERSAVLFGEARKAAEAGQVGSKQKHPVFQSCPFASLRRLELKIVAA